jgi:peptidyl-prolyl cis-trans isomerase SurA
MYFRFLIICVVLLFVSGVYAQKGNDVLLKVGDYPVTAAEFRYIYEKNNGSSADYSEKSIKEYLDLYTKFKLKVQKAKAMRLDTISELNIELAGYRKQLASSYLIDKEVTEELLKELYERMKYDVEFSHIFIPAAENALQKVKDEARMKLLDIKSRVIGGLSFEKAAMEYSEDKNTGASGGYMGYFTAKMPVGFYHLESALYNTPVGKISDIVESKIGFHLIKVLNKRPARGQIEVAHILFRSDQKTLADSVYRNLLSGGSFDDAVTSYSSDRNSVRNKGILPIFGINTFDNNFEEAAYMLSTDGAISAPVSTRSGWHIIKRISKPASDSYDIFVRRNKNTIIKDQRFDVAKFKLIEDIKKTNAFRAYPEVLSGFTAGLDDEFYSYKWSPSVQDPGAILFQFGKVKDFTVKDFAEYCRKNTKTRLKYDRSKPLNEVTAELYNDYVNDMVMEFEEQHLEEKYPDFKSLMREYEEGILLFEATKISVWDKANQDTIGLEQFFNSHNAKYKTDEKLKAEFYTIFSSKKKEADKIIAFARKNTGAGTLNKFNRKKTLVEYSEGEYDRRAREVMGVEWKENQISGIAYNEKDTRFVKVLKIFPSRQKSLSEARGYAVADYQDYLESQWIKQLKEEFSVQINESVLKLLIR